MYACIYAVFYYFEWYWKYDTLRIDNEVMKGNYISEVPETGDQVTQFVLHRMKTLPSNDIKCSGIIKMNNNIIFICNFKISIYICIPQLQQM